MGEKIQAAVTSVQNTHRNQPVAIQQHSSSGEPSGQLIQLASMINNSPRGRAQAQLRNEIQRSPRVQNLASLAGEINQGSRGISENGKTGLPLRMGVMREGTGSVQQRSAQSTGSVNGTGLPDQLKSGVESLSGISLDNVKVHYNSVKPAQLNALAYAQGSHIHVAPGQEQHLPHEAWHVVQQAQGRVKPTMQMSAEARGPVSVQLVSQQPAPAGSYSSTVAELNTQLKEAPDNPEHEKKLNELKTMHLAKVFETFIIESGRSPEEAEKHSGLLMQAHTPVASGLSEAQQGYQKLLKEELSLSTAQIMDFHKSAGYEFEFAGFSDGRVENIEAEILPSHTLLAKSEEFSQIFNLPYKLETDSDNTLEIVTPPYIVLPSAETTTIVKDFFIKLDSASAELRKMLAEPEGNLDTKIDVLNKSGFGKNWAVTSAASSLHATQSGKHGSHPYGQVNVSMTAMEIGEFLGKLSEAQATESKPDVKDTTQLVHQINKFLLKEYPEIDGRLREAFLLYSRFAANLLAIPSIALRNQYPEEERPEPNYATEIKESLHFWIKDHPHSVVLQYMNSLTENKDRFIRTVADSESVVRELIFSAFREGLGKAKKWFEAIERPRAEQEFTIAFDEFKVTLQAIKDQKVRLELVNQRPQKDQFLAEAANRANDKFEAWQEASQETIHKELQMLNLLILEKEEPPSKSESIAEAESETEFGAETFGSGLGVRKDTYLPTVKAGHRTLRVGEIRGTSELDLYVKE